MDDRQRAYVDYWSGFGAFLRDRNAPYKITTPSRGYWQGFGIGRTGFGLLAEASFRDRKLTVEIRINHPMAQQAFDLLETDRETIDGEFGEALDWQRMQKGCRISLYRTDTDPGDEAQRTTQYEWLLQRLQRFAAVFGRRIQELPLDNVTATTADEVVPDS